jgi:hypothetical protein
MSQRCDWSVESLPKHANHHQMSIAYDAIFDAPTMTQQPASPPDVYSIAVMTKSSSKVLTGQISHDKIYYGQIKPLCGTFEILNVRFRYFLIGKLKNFVFAVFCGFVMF